jgi:ketosteroid isomerase-like protein
MKTMHIFVLVAITVFSACECRHAVNSGEAKTDILAVIQQQERGWNAGSIEQYMNGYARSDSVRFASGGNVTYGWRTTLERYKRGYPDKASMGTLAFTNIDIKMLSDTSALVFGTWKLKRVQDEPWGLFTLIFHRTNDGWRIMHDHTSLAGK